jgi:hypothetical protein
MPAVAKPVDVELPQGFDEDLEKRRTNLPFDRGGSQMDNLVCACAAHQISATSSYCGTAASSAQV